MLTASDLVKTSMAFSKISNLTELTVWDIFFQLICAKSSQSTAASHSNLAPVFTGNHHLPSEPPCAKNTTFSINAAISIATDATLQVTAPRP
jgi:hypothetical protein